MFDYENDEFGGEAVLCARQYSGSHVGGRVGLWWEWESGLNSLVFLHSRDKRWIFLVFAATTLVGDIAARAASWWSFDVSVNLDALFRRETK